MIPRPFIDDLLQRVDIVDIIERTVRLKKAGKNHTACCPFHPEKTPSFTVSADKQFYHCFGCGAHGNAIGFLMAYDHLTFVEAIQHLAGGAGLTVPSDGILHEEKPQNQMGLSLEKANQYYQNQLKPSPQSARARQYLEHRGLSKETIGRFGLGFAPSGWDLLKRFFEKESILLPDAVLAGLLAEKEGGGLYDRFRDRIMFPIRNRKGTVVGFGGRVLNDEDKPKYLNSPETPIFHKGRELYGLYEARSSIREKDKVLVVEGYMDVIALSEQGIPYVVATLGTSVTEQHVEQLVRLVSHVIYCFDGDAPGQQAAWRALHISLPFLGNGKQISFLILPQNEDPDSLVRTKGQAHFLKRIEEALPLSTFLFRKLGEKVNLSSLEGRACFLNEAKEYLAKIRDPILVNLCSEELSKIARLEREQWRHLGGEVAPKSAKVQNQSKSLQKNTKQQTRDPIRLLMAFILQNPQLVFAIDRDISLQTLELPGIALLAQLIEFITENKSISTNELLEKYAGTENQHVLAQLATWDCPIPTEGVLAEFKGALECLGVLVQEQEMELLLAKSRLTGLGSDEKKRLQELITLCKGKTAQKRALVLACN